LSGNWWSCAAAALFDFAPGIRAHSDHFTGSGKMARRIMPTVLASNLRFDEYGFENLPFGIFKNWHQVTG